MLIACSPASRRSSGGCDGDPLPCDLRRRARRADPKDRGQAIGRAFLDGSEGALALNDDVYGTPLFATAGVAILCFIAGAVLVGVAIARTAGPLRKAGIAYAASLGLFPLLFFTIPAAAPIAAAIFTAVGIAIALRLPRQLN